MYCDQCGTAANLSARYCHKCGHQFGPSIVRTIPDQKVEEAPGSQESPANEVIPTAESQSIQVALSVPIQATKDSEKSPERQSPVAGIESIAVIKFHPWRRLFARMVDMMIATLILYLLLFYPIGEYPFVEYLSGTEQAVRLLSNPYVIGVLIFVLWAPIEAAFLSGFGATLGKVTFGIRVLDSDGNQLSYGQALRRSFGVLMYGVGFGIPIINLITGCYSYRRLKMAGATKWDDECSLLVLCRPWTPARGIVCVVVVTLVFVIMVVTPVFVAKVNINYSARRASLVKKASSAEVVQSNNTNELADKAAKQEVYYSCLRDWHDQHKLEWRVSASEFSDESVRNILYSYPDVLACEYLMGAYFFVTKVSGEIEFRNCNLNWQKKNSIAWLRFVKENTTSDIKGRKLWKQRAVERRPDVKACEQQMPARVIKDGCANETTEAGYKRCMDFWKSVHKARD